MNASRLVRFMIATLFIQRLDITRCDNDCARSRFFVKKEEEGAVLRNHIIAEHLVASEIECGYLCMRESKCVSFSYKDLSESLSHVCEISVAKQQNGIHGNSYFEREPGLLSAGVVSCHNRAESCLSLKDAGENSDGPHRINIPNIGSIQVFCDQKTDGGGWTLIQRRTSPFSLSFDRTWVEYENGFGNPAGEFWLGNKIIHELAKSPREVRIDLKSRENVTGYAVYSYFKVHGPIVKYRLEISGYHGNINDCGAPSSWQHFTTSGSGGNCAVEDAAGWWYGDCGCGNLNRQTRPKWYSWRVANDNIVFSEIKIR